MRKVMKRTFCYIFWLCIGFIIGALGMRKIFIDKLNETQKLSDKHLALYLLMNRWTHIKQEGKSISLYLRDMGYTKVAVYGMNYVGETLCSELKDSDIEVMYAIDKSANSISTNIKVIKPDDITNEVDAIIVTPVTYYDSIYRDLRNRIDCPILSIHDILYEV